MVNGFRVDDPPIPGRKPRPPLFATAPATLAAEAGAAEAVAEVETPETEAAEQGPVAHGGTLAGTPSPDTELANSATPAPPSPQAAAGTPPGAGEASPPVTSISRVVGSDPSDILALFGEPALNQEVPPARLWQYGTPNCVLRVYFYMDMATTDFRVLSYDLTSIHHVPNIEQQCLAELVTQAAQRPI